MRWGVDDVQEELARVRALRANPPGLAVSTDTRRQVFGAALEQFEQLLRAAEVIGPASAPLPLFYALSQAGRAIAAARLTDPARWNYTGHGIKAPEGPVPSAIGDLELKAGKSGKSAYRVVSESVGSAVPSAPMRLAELWASLPLIQVGDGLGAGLPLAVHARRTGPTPTTAYIEVTLDGRSEPVKTLLESYPALPALRLVVGPDLAGRPGVVHGTVSLPLGGRTFEDLLESYWSDAALYVRPAVSGEPPPSILMTWWAVLFALSHLARYAPAVWTAAISPDSSDLTVPIEDGLRAAKRSLPRLVYHGITGSWE